MLLSCEFFLVYFNIQNICQICTSEENLEIKQLSVKLDFALLKIAMTFVGFYGSGTPCYSSEICY